MIKRRANYSLPNQAACKNPKGFTMIELMFAMTFVAILIIAIAVLVMNIQSIYRRGLAVREVNATSRSLVDDITRAIAGAPAVGAGSHSVEFISGSRIEGGVFCTGFYSYVWKQAEFLRGGNIRVNGSNDYRLIKARDVGRSLCRRLNLEGFGGLDCDDEASPISCTVTGSSDLMASETTELISSGGLEIALFSFNIFQPAQSGITGQVFYAGSFILGTPRGADVTGGIVSSEACQPPNKAEAFDFQYCSINKFNFAASSLGAIGDR
ncbi:type II secretion system GspH family protein [Candidatus Saccharibacteria bacterium]|nr:type II secretion system GspH family protein [Candidatus Saccharibacteria bacterium]